MSQNSQSSNKTFYTADGSHSYHTAEGPIDPNQNLSDMEPSSAASSAAVASASAVVPTVVEYNTALASNPRMIRSMYLLVKSAGAGIHEAFQAEDITVTGGSAYCMYAEEDRRLPQMPTSDIDMVWWTSGRVDNGVISSIIPIFSTNIISDQNAQTTLTEIIQPLHLSPIQHIAIQVSEPKHFPLAGPIINSNLHLSILIDGTHLVKNICEISIHNRISSQIFNINHKYIGNNNASSPTRSSQADPIYCDRTENFTEKIYETRVPTFGRYVIQQLFAYKNLRIFATAETIAKSHIRLYRVLNFCLLGNTQNNTFIDYILSRSVRAVIMNLNDFGNIRESYIDEVERDLKDLYSIMGPQPHAFFPITFQALYMMRQELQQLRQRQRRQGGFRKKRTIKRKKNKSKTKKRVIR